MDRDLDVDVAVGAEVGVEDPCTMAALCVQAAVGKGANGRTMSGRCVREQSARLRVVFNCRPFRSSAAAAVGHVLHLPPGASLAVPVRS